MSWYQVVIEGEETVVKTGAIALMSKYEAAYRAAGAPENVTIYLRNTTTGAKIYYFSPKAFEIGKDIIPFYNVAQCPEPKQIKELKLIRL